MLDAIINWRFGLKALAWGGSMLGVLQLRHLSGSWSYALCGPWGCGPTLESVITCHLVWLLLLTPAVVMIIRRSNSDAVALCGTIAMAVGLVGVAGVALWTGVSWYPNVSSTHQAYVVQKFLFTVACLVDLPMLQLILAGLSLRFAGRRQEAPLDLSGEPSLKV